ncbi:MAG: hypothetical protein ABW003_16615 [Microvirga sp.]
MTEVNDEPVLLARAPRAVEYLRKLSKHPRPRPMGSHSGAFLRMLGLVDDEVITADKRKLTAAEALAEFGAQWYLSTQFTGKERITARGREELAKLKRQG